MNRIVMCFVVGGWLISPVLAQEETLFSGKIESGGYGGPTVKVGSFHGKSSLLMGGQGGWIINHHVVIGGGGYGLVTDVPVERAGVDKDQYLNLGYGGLLLEYVVNPNELLHVELQSLIGAGGVSFRDEKFSEMDGRDEERHNLEDDSFFVWEPGVNVVLNITKNFRFALGGTYRYVNGVSLSGTSEEELAHYTVQVGCKFGKF